MQHVSRERQTNKNKHAKRQRGSSGALNEGTGASELPLAKVMCLAIMLPRVVLCVTVVVAIDDAVVDVVAAAFVAFDSTQMMLR